MIPGESLDEPMKAPSVQAPPQTWTSPVKLIVPQPSDIYAHRFICIPTSILTTANCPLLAHKYCHPINHSYNVA